MLQQLKNLTRDTVIYGVGHIATRILTFLLLPYYSFHLSPAEYGELTLYFLFIGVAQAFYLYGLDIAFLRYFTLNKDTEHRRDVTGTAMIASSITSALLTLIIVVAAPSIGRLIVQNPTNPTIVTVLVQFSAGILLFDTLTTFPFLLLRGTLRPVHFTAMKLINVLINISLNIWFVGRLDLSIFGVLLANIIASAVTFILLIPYLWKNMRIYINYLILKEMLIFGLPNVPTYLFVMIVELADRKILELFRGLEEAGLYSAGYKLGMFMAVVTGAFRFAWQPFFLSHAEDENAPGLFARVLTYYLLITLTLFLALTFFVEPLIRTNWPGIGYIIEPRYWSCLAVFPIILMAHIYDGVYANFMVGVYLKKLTSRLPLVTGIAAVFTIVFNVIFIPAFGMMAAAWITLLSFLLQAVLLWMVVRRHYSVPYEWQRIGKLAVACGIILALSFIAPFNASWLRLVLLLMFPFLLRAIGFFSSREMQLIKEYLRLK